MAKKTGLTKAAERIGAAVGSADRKAHQTVKKVTHASKVAKQELASISKEVESLKKRLQKATKRLQKALA
jgi:polyhydroxyalkanoate synthesis regulator phasin